MQALVRRSLELLDPDQADVILDAGTGPGVIALRIAPQCNWVIGIDISRIGLELARKCAIKKEITNTTFSYGALEDPGCELDLRKFGINKILVLRSLSHLPDNLKKVSLQKLAKIIQRPGRIVIGDQIFFEPAEAHRESWEEVFYDGGITDRPPTDHYLIRTLRELGARVEVERLHPLAGVVVAYIS